MAKSVKKTPLPPKKRPEGGIFLTLRSLALDQDLDPFAVSDTIKEQIGDVLDATTDKNGDYLLRVRTEVQAAKITRLKKLVNGQKVKAEKHPTLNTSRCVIGHPTITKIEDARLAKELKQQDVVDVRSIKPTNYLKILTVKGSTIPATVRIGLLTVKTSPYYPMVRVCKNCCEVGHMTEECNQRKRCDKCSGAHEPSDCENPPYCGNCGGDHSPMTRLCPLFVQEKAIIKSQVDQEISAKRARKQAKRNPKYIPLPTDLPGRGHFNDDEDENPSTNNNLDSSLIILESDENEGGTPAETDPPQDAVELDLGRHNRSSVLSSDGNGRDEQMVAEQFDSGAIDQLITGGTSNKRQMDSTKRTSPGKGQDTLVSKGKEKKRKMLDKKKSKKATKRRLVMEKNTDE